MFKTSSIYSLNKTPKKKKRLRDPKISKCSYVNIVDIY